METLMVLPLLTALAAPVATGIFNASRENAARSENREDYARRIQTTVADAREAGIHPLEAIRSGAGNAMPQSVQPALMSTTAMQNAFDKVADVLTGRTAQENLDAQVRSDILRIERDILRRSGMVSPSQRQGVGAGSGASTALQEGALDYSEDPTRPVQRLEDPENPTPPVRTAPLTGGGSTLTGTLPGVEDINEPAVQHRMLPGEDRPFLFTEPDEAAMIGAQWAFRRVGESTNYLGFGGDHAERDPYLLERFYMRGKESLQEAFGGDTRQPHEAVPQASSQVTIYNPAFYMRRANPGHVQ